MGGRIQRLRIPRTRRKRLSATAHNSVRQRAKTIRRSGYDKGGERQSACTHLIRRRIPTKERPLVAQDSRSVGNGNDAGHRFDNEHNTGRPDRLSTTRRRHNTKTRRHITSHNRGGRAVQHSNKLHHLQQEPYDMGRNRPRSVRHGDAITIHLHNRGAGIER